MKNSQLLKNIQLITKRKTNFSILKMIKILDNTLYCSNMDNSLICQNINLANGMYSMAEISNFLTKDITPIISDIAMSDFPDCPVINHDSDGIKFNIDMGILKNVNFAVSIDNDQYTLNGILIDQNVIVAIDGRTMAKFDHKIDMQGQEFSVIMPVINSQFEFEDIVKFTLQNKRIFMTCNDIEISSTILNGKFPNYHMFIPKETKNSCTISVNDILEFININKKIFDTESQKFSITIVNNQIQLEAVNNDITTRAYNLNSTTNSGDMVIGINYKLLEKHIKDCKNEFIKLKFNASLAPVVIEFENRQKFGVIMPMKIQEEDTGVTGKIKTENVIYINAKIKKMAPPKKKIIIENSDNDYIDIIDQLRIQLKFKENENENLKNSANLADKNNKENCNIIDELRIQLKNKAYDNEQLASKLEFFNDTTAENEKLLIKIADNENENEILTNKVKTLQNGNSEKVASTPVNSDIIASEKVASTPVNSDIVAKLEAMQKEIDKLHTTIFSLRIENDILRNDIDNLKK